MRQAFLQDLIKAVSGEGSRGGKVVGHTSAGKPIYDHGGMGGRKTYPQQDTVSESKRKETFMPPEGTMSHYSDSPNLTAYKNLLRLCKQKGMDFQGHISYDPKSDSVMTISPQGSQMIKQIISQHQGASSK